VSFAQIIFIIAASNNTYRSKTSLLSTAACLIVLARRRGEGIESSNNYNSNTMATPQPFSEDSVAAADKEMEDRANRAKELLSRRYHGLKHQQVRRSCILW
jgi:hypothetical protein